MYIVVLVLYIFGTMGRSHMLKGKNNVVQVRASAEMIYSLSLVCRFTDT